MDENPSNREQDTSDSVREVSPTVVSNEQYEAFVRAERAEIRADRDGDWQWAVAGVIMLATVAIGLRAGPSYLS